MKLSFSGFVKKIKEGWAAKSPVLLFVLFFFGMMVLFYAFMQTAFYQHSFQPFIVKINARLASSMLHIFGENTIASGDLITSDRGFISVKRGCDALVPIFLFMSAIMAFPTKWKDKFTGLGLGISFLLFINLIRIANLYWVQIYYPSAFDLMHLEVWQVIFIILGILLWALWMQWTQKRALKNPSQT